MPEIVLRSKRTGGEESYDLHNANDPQLFHAAPELKKAERIGRKIVLKLVCDLWAEPQVFERDEFDHLDFRSLAVAESAKRPTVGRSAESRLRIVRCHKCQKCHLALTVPG